MTQDDRVEPPQYTLSTDVHNIIRVTRLVVWGMYCPGCGARIHSRLVAVKGVLEVYVDHAVGMVEVVFNSNLTTTAALIDAVVRAGDDGRHTFGATVSNTLLSDTFLQDWRQRNIH